MEEHIFTLASYQWLTSFTAALIVSTPTIDVGRFDLTQLGVWFKIHSITGASPNLSSAFWLESSYRPDDDFVIAPGSNSVAVTNSIARIFNLSSSYMPYIRFCAVNTSNGQASSPFSAYLFGQEL
jgi:hypothetical protein